MKELNISLILEQNKKKQQLQLTRVHQANRVWSLKNLKNKTINNRGRREQQQQLPVVRFDDHQLAQMYHFSTTTNQKDVEFDEEEKKRRNHRVAELLREWKSSRIDAEDEDENIDWHRITVHNTEHNAHWSKEWKRILDDVDDDDQLSEDIQEEDSDDSLNIVFEE